MKTESEIILRARDLCCAYGRNDPVLRNVSLEIRRDEKVAIVGENAVGKSSLLSALLRLPGAPTVRSGEALVFGAPAGTSLLGRIGFVLQCPDSNFLADTVLEELTFGPQARGWPVEKASEAADETLRRLNLAYLREALIERLCWGERKLLAVASSAILTPELLVLDDPYGGLGPRFQSDLASFLGKYPGTILATGASAAPFKGEVFRIQALQNGEIEDVV